MAFPLPDDTVFVTAKVEEEGRPPEAHFILEVPHPRDYAAGVALRYVGRTSLDAYREWDREASHFVKGSHQDPAVIAFTAAAGAAVDALDTLRNTID